MVKFPKQGNRKQLDIIYYQPKPVLSLNTFRLITFEGNRNNCDRKTSNITEDNLSQIMTAKIFYTLCRALAEQLKLKNKIENKQLNRNILY